MFEGLLAYDATGALKGRNSTICSMFQLYVNLIPIRCEHQHIYGSVLNMKCHTCRAGICQTPSSERRTPIFFPSLLGKLHVQPLARKVSNHSWVRNFMKFPSHAQSSLPADLVPPRSATAWRHRDRLLIVTLLGA